MKTEVFQLRNHLWISIFLLMILMVITLVIVDVASQVFAKNSQTGKLLTTFICFSILCFLVIPELKLPKGKRAFTEYLSDIRLRVDSNILGIVLITLSCYLIFAALQFAGSLIYFSYYPGHYIYDFGKNSLLSSGSLNSGIFEEVIFRGVILTLLLEKISEKKAISVSAATFAGIHLLNLLNPGDREVLWILTQVLWAFALGIMYGYLVIRMTSLIPAILLHYLINAFTGIWLNIPEDQNVISAMYNLAFFGVIPAGMTILWIRYLDKYNQLRSLRTPKNLQV